MVNSLNSIRPVGIHDELVGSQFWVEVGDLLVASFLECSGLGGEVAVESYQEGGLNNYEHKLPGRTTYGNITLRVGVANAPALYKWFSDASMGQIVRKNVSIIMYLQNGQEAMRWNIVGAFPVRWEGPSFTSSDSDVTVQSLELAHHGISLASQ